MCLRLYLNGNGIGRTIHISIFLVLMRGDYDAILDWSFDFQVIFCLHDLRNQTNHLFEAFQTDTKSSSFQRPQAEMNVGYGIPKFIPLSVIQQDNSPYVSDDSMFIRVMIRKNPIPKFLLSDVVNIDPGLPISLQDQKIEEIQSENNPITFKLVLNLKLSVE